MLQYSRFNFFFFKFCHKYFYRIYNPIAGYSKMVFFQVVLFCHYHFIILSEYNLNSRSRDLRIFIRRNRLLWCKYEKRKCFKCLRSWRNSYFIYHYPSGIKTCVLLYTSCVLAMLFFSGILNPNFFKIECNAICHPRRFSRIYDTNLTIFQEHFWIIKYNIRKFRSIRVRI